MKVKVLLFGVLTELTGTNIKYCQDVKSIDALKLKLQDEFPEIVHYNYMISLNNVIINNSPELKDGDEVALLPPFAGG